MLQGSPLTLDLEAAIKTKLTTAEVLAQLRNAPKTVKERMLLLLSDEQPHTREELHACLWDELAQLESIGPRLHELRQELNRVGDDIIVERSSLGYRYRLARGHLLPLGSG